MNPELSVSLLYISVAIKASLLKFNMFSIQKNNISNSRLCKLIYPGQVIQILRERW